MGLFDGYEHIVRQNELLAPFTWFRLGGPAEYFAEPTSVEELGTLVARANEAGLPIGVIGGGSNLLIRDTRVKGLVLHLAAPAFCQIDVQGNVVTAGGGAKLGHVISATVGEGLSGLEELVGIPGSVGGALRSNADAGGADIGKWTRSATVMKQTGEIVVHDRDALRFSYRSSSLDELVILNAELELETGDSAEITKRLQKLWIIKKANEPQGTYNAGCIFKDVGGVSAASLIENAGLRSSGVGKAVVCDENANFIIAEPGATFDDVCGLIELLKSGVEDRLGVELETSIDIW
ncbi:MAG TPA: UDP-N-acetylmuramate dehydrogenase [Pirellulaceae bacterium]|jgi:UDP-N-acetylmuramate dehydrogenase|nr:UDP-N-acetylmuramate dehydrogenase [Pirellulaceae bacterium]